MGGDYCGGTVFRIRGVFIVAEAAADLTSAAGHIFEVKSR